MGNGLQMRYFVLKPSIKDAYGKASLAALKAFFPKRLDIPPNSQLILNRQTVERRDAR